MTDRPIRVLLVEDDEDDYIMTRDLLSEIEGKTFALEWAATYEASLEAMSATTYDICLVDYRLGAKSGLDLLQEALRQGDHAPIIMLTGQDDRHVDIKAMQIGAADYLVKGRD